MLFASSVSRGVSSVERALSGDLSDKKQIRINRLFSLKRVAFPKEVCYTYRVIKRCFILGAPQ